MDAKKIIEKNKDFVKGVVTTLLAIAIWKSNCKVLMLMAVLSLVVYFIGRHFANQPVKNFSKKIKWVPFILIIAAMLSYGMYHKICCHNQVVEQKPEMVSEVQKEEIPEVPEVKNEVAEQPKATEASKTVERDHSKDAIYKQQVIETTTTNTEEEKEVIDQEESNMGQKSELDEKSKEELDNARKDEDQIVNDLNEGISTITTKEDTKKEETKPASNPETVKPQTDETKTDVEVPTEIEIPTETKKVESTEKNPETKEVVKNEKEEGKEDLADVSNLNDVLVKTEKETTTTVKTDVEVKDVKQSEKAVTIKQLPKEEAIEKIEKQEEVVEEKNVVEEKTEEKVEEPVEEKVEEKVAEKAISVEAIDGYTTYINSQIQFKVEGENPVVSGLDGDSYTLNNGVLTVDVGEYAGMLTFYVSNSTNFVRVDVTVNGIIG